MNKSLLPCAVDFYCICKYIKEKSKTLIRVDT